jgi:hypothetical protein
MNYRLKMLIPILGMCLLFVYAATEVVSTNTDDLELPLPASLQDLSKVKLIEVRDGAGEVVLSGSFGAPVQKAKGTEYSAVLVATNVDADATGEAEIEISKSADGFIEQELEVNVERLAPLTTFKLFVDGQEITPFTTSRRGEAEIEISNEASK